MSRLHALEFGNGPTTLVFLHGVFGQGKNFGNVAKKLSEQMTSVLLDLPNHGRSAWTKVFDYDIFAGIVAEELYARGHHQNPVLLVGHSMGGKIAMRVALRYPSMVRALVVEDSSPVSRGGDTSDFPQLASSLLELDLTALATRNQADAALSSQIPDPAVRAFMLQNLHRDPKGGGWQWLANLALLRDSVDKVFEWPPLDTSWSGPVLWMSGGRSDHVRPEDEPVMRTYFPHERLLTIPQAGHWIHAEQPQAVADAIAHFARELR